MLTNDKSARQTATERKGIACAFRDNSKSPVIPIQCPQHFTCAWTLEGAAICEAPTAKLVIQVNQFCTNILAGCVCTINSSTKDCQAGQKCANQGGAAACSNSEYTHFEVLKGQDSYCGMITIRDKTKTQYCSFEGVGSYKDVKPGEKVFANSALITHAKEDSKANKYVLQGKQVIRQLKASIKI